MFKEPSRGHSRALAEDQYMDFDKRAKKVIMRPRLYFASAGFVKYANSYAERQMLSPAPIGPTVIKFTGSDSFASWDRGRISFDYIS